ncbi:uncharacterized protein LOC130808285 [Amaranthus tricolor]|uniref:uncharacterized protein LOC130808285 n=1 Tax=Amaranthus tricolor TaxID=29722 RepID=UPI002584F80E|nr:uncharacterized protein LOC130808285 [Amaranthus tricolor]
MRMIYGDANEEYSRFWDYAEAIRKLNSAYKEGFVTRCRRIIRVDGEHLKGPYPGILLTAVAKDGNNNIFPIAIFPIAWAMVATESANTWTWFLALLVDDINLVTDKDSEITFMSDRQKGLIDALKNVVLQSEVRFCCRYIWTNFKKQFSRELFRHLLWKAARATTNYHFQQQMTAIKDILVEAYEYLVAIPSAHWSKHAFTTKSKSGMLLNNCCESFNNVLRDAMGKPIISLMEWIRRYVMQSCAAKREGLMDEDDETYVVNLQTMKCTCYKWNLLGIPCTHAMACNSRRKLDFVPYVKEAYYVSTYVRTCSPIFHGMPGHKQWTSSKLARPLPPPFRNMPGRPSKKKRKPEADEGRDGKKKKESLVSRGKKNKCANCGNFGHYKKTCKNPLQVHRRPSLDLENWGRRLEFGFLGMKMSIRKAKKDDTKGHINGEYFKSESMLSFLKRHQH